MRTNGRRCAGFLVLVCALTAGAPPAPGLAPQRPGATDSALAVAVDSAAALEVRAAALHALRGRCARDAVPALMQLGRPYRQPWVVWRGALLALSDCPFPELAPFWRDLVTFPRRPVRELAVVGLARTGARGDRELLAEATHREMDPAMRRLAAWADSLLGRPADDRGGVSALRAPPPDTGRPASRPTP